MIHAASEARFRSPIAPVVAEPCRDSRRELRAFLVAAALIAIGVMADHVNRSAFRAQVEQSIQRTQQVVVTGLQVWLDRQRAAVTIWSRDPQVRGLTAQLIPAQPASRAAAAAQAALARLRAALAPVCDVAGFEGFMVVDASGRVRAASGDASIGRPLPPELEAVFAEVGRNGPRVIPPRPLSTAGGEGAGFRPGVLYAAGPIADAAGKPLAVLAFTIPAERDFWRLLVAGRAGASGEAYAFDRHGLLLSPSRFEGELAATGLLARGDPAVMRLELRDPGIRLAERGDRVTPPRRWPLTRAVSAAVAGTEGSDVEGYGGYLGHTEIGAWTWFAQDGFGVVSEIRLDEAFRVFAVPRLVLGGLSALLLASVIVVLLSHARAAARSVQVTSGTWITPSRRRPAGGTK